MERLDNSRAHLALQEVLRIPDTFAAARRDSAERRSGLKRLLAPIAARLVPFFARRQVEWNFAVAKALEATVRSLDERDRWIEELAARLRSTEEKVAQLETELRSAREAEDDARKKVAVLGVRLRDLEERRPRPERTGPA
jgi:septal ring factor EnvC (AmiA/AmiB activator)